MVNISTRQLSTFHFIYTLLTPYPALFKQGFTLSCYHYWRVIIALQTLISTIIKNPSFHKRIYQNHTPPTTSSSSSNPGHHAIYFQRRKSISQRRGVASPACKKTLKITGGSGEDIYIFPNANSWAATGRTAESAKRKKAFVCVYRHGCYL